MVGNGFQWVQGWQGAPEDQRLANSIYRIKVGKGYLEDKGWKRVPEGSRLAKGT